MQLTPFTYLDIHTHSSLESEEVLSIRNQILGVDPPLAQAHSAGIHPWYINEAISHSVFKGITQDEHCLLIGECGLDKMVETDLDLQVQYFSKQVQWADHIQKPVIIHCVKAHQEILQLHQQLQPKVPWIIHGFNKKKELAQQYLSKGIYLSFGAAIINNTHLQNTLKEIPLESIFLETDDQKEYTIRHVYEAASQLLNIDLATLQRQIETNFKTLLLKCRM